MRLRRSLTPIVIVGAAALLTTLALLNACASSSSPASDAAPISPELNDDAGRSGPGESSSGAHPADASGDRRDGSSSMSDDDDGGGGGATGSGCTVKRTANADLCADDCDARLQLSAGGRYFCTQQCEKDEDCVALGGASALKCPATIGACVPSCASDSACKAQGFLRCDLTTGGCDTIAE